MGATMVLESESDSPLNDVSVSDSTPKGFQQLAGGRAQPYLQITSRFIFDPEGSQHPLLRPFQGRVCRAIFPVVSLRSTTG
jgi:hypothetical protein